MDYVISLVILAPLMYVLFRGLLALRRWVERRAVALWSPWVLGREWDWLPECGALAAQFSGGPLMRWSPPTTRAPLGYMGVYNGVEVTGFRYEVVTGRASFRYQVNLVRFKGADFPTLSIATEKWHNKVLGSDITFESSEFNRRWWVKSDNARFAHSVLHPRVISAFVEAELPGHPIVWFEGDAILIATEDHGPGFYRPAPKYMDDQIDLLTRVGALLPRYVLQDMGSDAVLEVTDEGPAPPPNRSI